MGGQATKVQVKEIIEVALKPIRDALGKLLDRNYLIETVAEFVDQKMKERDEKIKSLEERVEKEESSLTVVNKRQYKIDNEEQYSRRQCLRINSIDLPEENVSEDCKQKVHDILNELDCGVVGIDSVDRAHTIGPRKASNVDRNL